MESSVIFIFIYIYSFIFISYFLFIFIYIYSFIFISSKDIDEKREMYSKSNNTEFETFDNVNDFFDELFKLLLSGH